MSEQGFRITRRGVLAVYLMPRYHGAVLERAIERITLHGPKDKHEQAAVWRANDAECDGPKFKATIDR